MQDLKQTPPKAFYHSGRLYFVPASGIDVIRSRSRLGIKVILGKEYSVRNVHCVHPMLSLYGTI